MAHVELEDMLARLQPQADEFNALVKLTEAYNALPAVVDDDYPRMRHQYESAVKTFLEACRANGRTA